MKKQLGNLFNTVDRAAKKAVENVGQVAGVPSDPDLRLYDTLKPEDFNAILKEYGTDNTMQYIRKMESRKLIGGKNA